MRNTFKKIFTFATAAVLSLGAASLSACDKPFQPLSGGPAATDAVISNGGFVVVKGDYAYFINGVDAYTSDNTYGTPVKASLMRISMTDLAARKNTAEVVVPSLMVTGDYTAGLYIFGDRIYFATPGTGRNFEGEIESGYLDFKSAKLDGSDIQDYFSLEDNSTPYRFVKAEGDTVYAIYSTNSELHSYNTSTKEDLTLATNVGSYVFNSEKKDDPYIYFTMSVTMDMDIENGSLARDYNQIYRVRADVTEETAPYRYTFDEDYIKEHDGEIPYVNLGTAVLDGIGALYAEEPTQFTHDLKDGVTPGSYAGYTYTLLSYVNGGLYFTRSDLATTGTTGETGWLYYLDEDKLSSGWNSVSGNADVNLDVIAQNTTNASSSAIFYADAQGQHYLYVSGANLFRADVRGDGSGIADEVLVARGVSGATLLSLDNTSDEIYHYVYYTQSAATGLSINRAVYNGTEEDYKILGYEDNKPYQPVKLLNIEHASGWYNPELIDGRLFFADTRTYGSTSYNYIATVNLKNANGELMNNLKVSEWNGLFEALVGGTDTDGYFAELDDEGKTSLSDALEYYFYMGQNELYYTGSEADRLANGYLTYDKSQFAENISFAVENNKKQTYLYSEEEQQLFKAYAEGTGKAEEFKDGSGNSYRTYSYFVTRIGQMNETDRDSFGSYWKSFLKSYTPAEAEETSLPGWAWALIGVGIGLVLIGIGLAVFFILRARKGDEEEEEPELLEVDTTDDRSVDVYSDEISTETEPESPETEEAPTEEAPTEEGSEEPADKPTDEE